ncbi:hypothetical protein HK105_209420 [Polyrhizophydium stewartii]|uniref:Uncharacterized protein n=1 Tax=Polyrhizophydium stewartii TaxID=2732419 RepID=A0ABR4MV45_9FUNG
MATTREQVLKFCDRLQLGTVNIVDAEGNQFLQLLLNVAAQLLEHTLKGAQALAELPRAEVRSKTMVNQHQLEKRALTGELRAAEMGAEVLRRDCVELKNQVEQLNDQLEATNRKLEEARAGAADVGCATGALGDSQPRPGSQLENFLASANQPADADLHADSAFNYLKLGDVARTLQAITFEPMAGTTPRHAAL